MNYGYAITGETSLDDLERKMTALGVRLESLTSPRSDRYHAVVFGRGWRSEHVARTIQDAIGGAFQRFVEAAGKP